MYQIFSYVYDTTSAVKSVPWLHNTSDSQNIRSSSRVYILLHNKAFQLSIHVTGFAKESYAYSYKY